MIVPLGPADADRAAIETLVRAGPTLPSIQRAQSGTGFPARSVEMRMPKLEHRDRGSDKHSDSAQEDRQHDQSPAKPFGDR